MSPKLAISVVFAPDGLRGSKDARRSDVRATHRFTLPHARAAPAGVGSSGTGVPLGAAGSKVTTDPRRASAAHGLAAGHTNWAPPSSSGNARKRLLFVGVAGLKVTRLPDADFATQRLAVTQMMPPKGSESLVGVGCPGARGSKLAMSPLRVLSTVH